MNLNTIKKNRIIMEINQVAHFIRFKKLKVKNTYKNKTLPKYSQAICFDEQDKILSFTDSLGSETVIVFTTEDRSNAILNFIEKENIAIEQRIITKALLVTSNENQYMRKLMEHIKNSKLLEEFYLANFTVDDVLDKVLEFGMDQLSELDKQILSKY